MKLFSYKGSRTLGTEYLLEDDVGRVWTAVNIEYGGQQCWWLFEDQDEARRWLKEFVYVPEYYYLYIKLKQNAWRFVSPIGQLPSTAYSFRKLII